MPSEPIKISTVMKTLGSAHAFFVVPSLDVLLLIPSLPVYLPASKDYQTFTRKLSIKLSMTGA